MPSAITTTMASTTEAAAPAALLEEFSRIFIKNLPPNITDEQLRKHFSAGNRHITDIKLIIRRRIAFIGYRSPEEANGAVRYFHRSYIRMSKLAVELAKPISDSSLPTAQKMKRLHEAHVPEATDVPTPVDDDQLSKKRKRDPVNLDEASNPRLREFLSVMKPQHGLTTTAEIMASMGDGPSTAADVEELTTVQAALDGESDDEYGEISKRPSKKTKPPIDEEAKGEPEKSENASAGSVVISATAIETTIPSEKDQPTAPSMPLQHPKPNPAATDDEWLRSRTNRLLDLLDPSELVPVSTPVVTVDATKDKIEEDIEMYDNEDKKDVSNDATQQQESAAETEEAVPQPRVPDTPETLIRHTSRLFVRNLPYEATEVDIRGYFETFGSVEEVNLPVSSSGANKGYGMVLFDDPLVALAAFHNADGKTFQGRILHVLPAKAKKTIAALDEFALSKLPLKKQRLLRKKAEAATSTFSWNALFMGTDAVNAAVAERLGVAKSELLDPTSSDEAVRQAVRQTSIIEEMRDYFGSNGVDLDAFKTQTKRGDTCILVKNFTYGTSAEELRKMFEEYGRVQRVLLPPGGTIAIVQYEQAAHGRLAYSRLAYKRVDDTVLMLEKCPDNILAKATSQTLLPPSAAAGAKSKLSGSDLLAGESKGGEDDGGATETEGTTSSLFVRNLNFTTTTAQLAAAFSPLDGFVAARVKTKPDPKKPGQTLSMGYGFVEFRTQAQAAGASKAMDGHILAGHTLTVQASHRGQQDAAATQREADRAKKLAANQGSKLIIKNIPFEATRKDLRTLLGTYGQLRAVRMPKKFGNSTRGYAFAEFVTAREAAHAMTALRNTHLLGRRLVLEFAEAEAVDAEEEIAKMARKTGAQLDSVAMQQLTTGRSHRAKVQIGEEVEE